MNIKKLGLVTFFASVIFAQSGFAQNQCIPSASVICTVSCDAFDVYVSTSFQAVSSFSGSVSVPEEFSAAKSKALALANDLKAAGVCAFVVDNTANGCGI